MQRKRREPQHQQSQRELVRAFRGMAHDEVLAREHIIDGQPHRIAQRGHDHRGLRQRHGLALPEHVPHEHAEPGQLQEERQGRQTDSDAAGEAKAAAQEAAAKLQEVRIGGMAPLCNAVK